MFSASSIETRKIDTETTVQQHQNIVSRKD